MGVIYLGWNVVRFVLVSVLLCCVVKCVSVCVMGLW